LTISAETVRFEGERMWVGLRTGGGRRAARVVPAAGAGGAAEREGLEIGASGVHWETLDEDVPVEGLLAGRGDRRRAGGEAA
jgi:hypothetical protein